MKISLRAVALVIVLSFTGLAQSAHAAIVFDNASSAESATTTSSFAFPHTVNAGSDLILMVGATLRSSSATFTSVTYNGVALIKISGFTQGSVRTELWYLINPPVGTFNVTLNASASRNLAGGAMTFTGVHQTTPLGTSVQIGAQSDSTSLNVSSAAGEMVVDVVGQYDGGTLGSLTVGPASQTEQYRATHTNTSLRVAGSTEPGAATVTMSWTFTDNPDHGQIAVPLKPAPAADTGDVYYSIGTNAADLKTGSPLMSITSGIAILNVAQTGNIGVGDEIDYDTDNKIAYIKSVVSQTEFVLHTATGGVPANVTIVTVNAIKRAFNTLASAEADSGNASHLTTFDLTAAGANANLTWVAYNDAAFTAGAIINGYTTDATHFITLTVADSSQVASGTSQRHNGTAGSGVVLDGQNLVGGVEVNDDYTVFEWFEIIRTGGANGRAAATAKNATNVIFDHLLIHNYTTGLASYGIKGSDNSTFTVRNCIIYDGQSSGIRLSAVTSTGTVQNCTVYGITGNGINQDDGTITVTNSISMGSSILDFDFTTGTQSFNLSSDATATGTGSLINKVTANQFVNLTAGSEDLHLKAGADAIDTGTDLSGSFSDDIDGDARPIGAAWDIGADETSAATPAVTSAIAEISPNDVATSSTANAFSYDIQVTISGGDTGVNRVAITVPASFIIAASPVTDVLVGGVSVGPAGYTDNTTGNTISVDLTTKVTASDRITVLFDADAPTSQDTIGVDFLSTVDDSGTGDAAQATTEGNGDGDAGDANSWTVTTTDGSGGPGNPVVNSTGDAGDLVAGDGVCDTGGLNSASATECTLRAAIEESNAFAGLGTITFNMPTSEPGYLASPLSYTITPATSLPSITGQVVLDGSTQPGFTSSPIVKLDGVAGATVGHGLTLASGSAGSTLRGLIIWDFLGTGNAGIKVESSNNTIAGNWIGLNADGVTAIVNNSSNFGIYIRGAGADNNIIGGTVAADRNVIASNRDYIQIHTSNNNVVLGNYLGTDWTGTVALGSGRDGVRIVQTSAGNTIGGNSVAARNIIAAAANDGVQIDSTASNTIIQGNYIGTDVSGTLNFGHGQTAIQIGTNAGNGNLIGGAGANEGNLIAFSIGSGGGGEGVLIESPSTDNAVLGNSIHSNFALGIDLSNGTFGITANDAGDVDTGPPNDFLNFPVITSATENAGTVTVNYDLDVPAGNYRIEFFSNPSGADPSGNGEGEVFKDAVTISHGGTGLQSFVRAFSGSTGDIITATATLELAGPAYKSTSEFSAAYTVTAAPAVTSAVAEISPNNVVTSSSANAFSYDIQVTIAGADTGVNRVAITVPGTFGAPTVTGVQVGGTGVAFTNNTAGNAISVDLTTRVTTSSKITVLFDANAPTTQDLTGVDFTSTVDDSASGAAAQATTEGNGDGDAGDANSWTVTTTGASSATLSRWPLNETSGTVAADIGASHDGTYSNGVTLNQAGACANTDTAVHFNGETSGQYIVIPHHDDYLLDNGTISLWANIDMLPNTDSEPEHALFSKDSNGFDTGGHVDMRVLTGGTVEVRMQSATANFLVTGAAITATNWFHVAFSWGAGGMKLYIDGGAPVTDTYTGGLGTTSGGIGNFEAIVLAASQFTSDPDFGITPLRRWMQGYLDDVRIYDSALGLAEIQAIAACAGTPAVTSTLAEISPNDVTTSSTGNAFSYDIQATISGGDTGVDRLAITVPATFTTVTVTDVQVDGVSVAYTDNTVGNAISVDLTTKVTTSSKLTVLFTANAPTTQDLTGANFLSTVDDSGTGVAAQSTTEGNGDADAGDNNSWTVTTTDGGVVNPAVTATLAEISPNDVATNSTTNAFSYDIQATIGGGDTGVNRVAITVPVTFGAPTVTAVQVGGSPVAYTDNTVGNALSVDLTTKVTTSSKITVLFTSNAPTTQDLTGVNFLSTVDDSGTGDVAQSTTEGDGDGDALDNNSWAVTTTNAILPGALGRYCLKEAGSGTGPASVADDQASPLNLSITYDAPIAWFTHASGNRGLNAASDPHVGIAVAAANGTKYATNLNGATQATFALVADWLPAADTQRIAGFFRNGDTRVAYIMADGSGRVELRFRMAGGLENSVRWPTAYQDGVRRVFHVVYDADDPTDTSRIRLYVNGVDQGAGTITQGAWPTLGATLDFSSAILDLAIMNEPLLGKPMDGTVYYYAVYDSELTNSDIATDASALLADDDCAGTPPTPAVSSAVAEISPNDVTTSSTVNAFSYDILVDVGAGATGVDRVAITVPVSFTTVAVTGVLVGGISVGYTDNTAGNAISVDLTFKVTTIDRITVLFTADAPVTQDLTGVDFLSTVDDTSTADIPQATTEGNGDGDGGDANSWTVTTTDAAGGSCDVDSTGTYIEAENYTALVNGTNGEFSLGSSQAGYNGTGYISTPNANGQSGQRVDYTIYFPSTGTYYVWIRAWAATTGSDSIYFGVDGTLVPPANNFDFLQGTGWHWHDQSSANFTVSSAGQHTLNLWGRENNLLADGIYITQTSGAIPGGTSIGIPTGATIIDPNNCGASNPAVASAVAEISPNDVATNSTGNTFEYDIGVVIGAGDTGVNRVAITVPGIFSVPASPVFNVLVDGFSVAFTDNTVGNVISVDLTTKVTTTSQITVIFDADAPTSQDLTGVDFLSTVDDSGTGDAAQSSTEGNGDGDAADANSWTVTTTGAVVAGSCLAIDGVASTGSSTTSSLTISHTTAGNDRLMIVSVSIDNNQYETVTAVTYNSIALTFVGAEASDNDARMEIWQLTQANGLTTGPHDVVITFSADLQHPAIAGVMTFTGVDQTTPLGAFFGNFAILSATGSVTVTSAVGELVLGAFSGETVNSITTNPPAVERWNLSAGGTGETEFAAGATDDGAASVTITWPLGKADHWAAGGVTIKPSVGCGGGSAASAAVAEISPNNVTTSSTANAFSYDIQATISGSDTGVDRVAITVPSSFGAPTVTDVQVGGVSVAFTDNTAANAISVDLTAKVTTSSKITVLFSTDAPTTVDATGVDFLSTVDDSGNVDAPQSTTEGNGDGDAGDNNDWTVTTTDAGGACSITIDGTPTAHSGKTNGTSITISHTTSGTDRLMLVGVSINNDDFETVDTVTYNGIALSYVDSITQSDDARVEIWQLTETNGLPTGTHDVFITFKIGATTNVDLDEGAVAGVMTFNGVDQTTPLGTFTGNEATSSTASVVVSSAVDELVFAVVSGETVNSITTVAPATQHWNDSEQGSVNPEYGAGATDDGAASVTMTWSLGKSDHWAAGGVSIKPASTCGGGGGGLIDHFAIVHDGNGINCQAENITITAHDASHTVNTGFTGTIILSTSTAHGVWSLVSGSGSMSNSSRRGAGVYAFHPTDAGVVVLGLRNTFAETTNINLTHGGASEHATEDPDLLFARAGFNFLAGGIKNTIGTQIGGKASDVAPGVQTLELQAVKTSDDTGACEAALQGSNTIEFAFECTNPTTCMGAQLAISGTDITDNASGAVLSYNPVGLDFGGSADSTATYTLSYPDVGELKLHARLRFAPSGEWMLGGSNKFVVRPFALHVTATGNPAAISPTDPVFTSAGTNFTANVTAVLWDAADDLDNNGIADSHDDINPGNNADLSDNAVAFNYGQESAAEQVLLTATLDQPAGGANPGLSGGTSISIFSAGSGATSTLRYDEVGIIEITAAVSDGNYLGIGTTETTNIRARSGYVGRFNPAQYAVTASSIVPACSATFTYARQTFTGTMTIEAQNGAAGGSVRTANYRAGFVTLEPATELTFLNDQTAAAYDSKTVTYNQNFDSVTTGEAVLALQFRWNMPEQAPTTSTVQNTEVTDEVTTLAAAPVSIGSSPTRFGRAAFGSAAGSELVNLAVPLRTEYYVSASTGYVTNVNDFCSSGATLSFSDFAGNLGAGETCVEDSGSPGASGAGCLVAGPVAQRYDDPLIAGEFNLFLQAPGAGNDGSGTVDANVPDWLEFDWDTGAPGIEDPWGRFTFGIYGGDKNQVYRRELY